MFRQTPAKNNTPSISCTLRQLLTPHAPTLGNPAKDAGMMGMMHSAQCAYLEVQILVSFTGKERIHSMSWSTYSHQLRGNPTLSLGWLPDLRS